MNNVYKEYYSRGPGVRTCLMPGSQHRQERHPRPRLIHRGTDAVAPTPWFLMRVPWFRGRAFNSVFARSPG